MHPRALIMGYAMALAAMPAYASPSVGTEDRSGNAPRERQKSRQERRASDRGLRSYGDDATSSKPRSASLERLIGKRKSKFYR